MSVGQGNGEENTNKYKRTHLQGKMIELGCSITGVINEGRDLGEGGESVTETKQGNDIYFN